MTTFKPIYIDEENLVLPVLDGQFIVANVPFSDGTTSYEAGVYTDQKGARRQLTMQGIPGEKGEPGENGKDALPIKIMGETYYDTSLEYEWDTTGLLPLPSFSSTEEGTAYLVDDNKVKGQYDLYIHNYQSDAWVVIDNWGGVPGQTGAGFYVANWQNGYWGLTNWETARVGDYIVQGRGESTGYAIGDIRIITQKPTSMTIGPSQVGPVIGNIRGAMGKDGVGIASITPFGNDGNGGNIYKITFTDDTFSTFSAPKGDGNVYSVSVVDVNWGAFKVDNFNSVFGADWQTKPKEYWCRGESSADTSGLISSLGWSGTYSIRMVVWLSGYVLIEIKDSSGQAPHICYDQSATYSAGQTYNLTSKFVSLQGQQGQQGFSTKFVNKPILTITYAQLQDYGTRQVNINDVVNASDFIVGDTALVNYIISDRNNSRGLLIGEVLQVDTTTLRLNGKSYICEGATGQPGQNGQGLIIPLVSGDTVAKNVDWSSFSVEDFYDIFGTAWHQKPGEYWCRGNTSGDTSGFISSIGWSGSYGIRFKVWLKNYIVIDIFDSYTSKQNIHYTSWSGGDEGYYVRWEDSAQTVTKRYDIRSSFIADPQNKPLKRVKVRIVNTASNRNINVIFDYYSQGLDTPTDYGSLAVILQSLGATSAETAFVGYDLAQKEAVTIAYNPMNSLITIGDTSGSIGLTPTLTDITITASNASLNT